MEYINLKRRCYPIELEDISDDESCFQIPTAKRRCLKSRNDFNWLHSNPIESQTIPKIEPRVFKTERSSSPKTTSPAIPTVLPRITRSAPTESLETRRLQRERLVRAMCDLTVRVQNKGFTMKDFDLEIARLGDITKYRKNDENGTMQAAARRHGIVFFLDRQTDTYYLDDLHAQAWGIALKPKGVSLSVASGSKRGLENLIKKKGGYRFSRYAMKPLTVVKADRDVMNFCKLLYL